MISSSFKFTTNEKIRLASTFHSMHAISSQLTPQCPETRTGPSFLSGTIMEGISEIVTDTFRLQCFQSLTGVKFILVSEPAHKDQDACLRAVYDAYADHVAKNPFQELEMPIRSDLFDAQLNKIFAL